MPKISDAKREARRTEILDAALRCFVRAGYHHTSMADIIAESGLSAGAIYSYFTSKGELVREVAGRIIEQRRSELGAAESEHILSPAEIVMLLIEGLRRDAPLRVLVQVWGEATVDPDLHAPLQATLAGMRSTIAAALTRWAEVHPEHVPTGTAPAWGATSAPVVMALIPGFALQTALVDDFDPDAFLRAIPGVLPSAG